MRTTSDTASDLPKVSDLPQVSGRGCVCPQSLPCPEFLILPPKPSCPSSCGDPRPSSTPYKPLPSYPELPKSRKKSQPAWTSPALESLYVHLPDLSEPQLPYQENGACGWGWWKDSVSWVSSSPVAHAHHVAGAICVPGNRLVQAGHLSHPPHPQPGLGTFCWDHILGEAGAADEREGPRSLRKPHVTRTHLTVFKQCKTQNPKRNPWTQPFTELDRKSVV